MTKKTTFKIAIAFSVAMLLGTSLFMAFGTAFNKKETSNQSITQIMDNITNPIFTTKACCRR
jgi:hypothetical protein